VTALRRSDLDADPLTQFQSWFAAAGTAGIAAPEAMMLATAGSDGRPSARMVLLRGADSDGFVFFTGYRSRKAAELDANPQAALLFHWQPLGRQVRVEGGASRVDSGESDAYFASRPLESRLGAWASEQSAEIEGRSVLESAVAKARARFGADVPRPPRWGGYRVTPDAYEFWQHGEHRLHDRFRYTLDASGRWTVARLAP
jgi:pyridoxamine 5'-phosphate oxidase